MTFRRWDEIPEHERETEATIRRRWEGYRERDPRAPWVAQFDELVEQALAAYRERLTVGSCEAAIAAYGGKPPYMPCRQPAVRPATGRDSCLPAQVSRSEPA
jgi:hypothetical protein